MLPELSLEEHLLKLFSTDWKSSSLYSPLVSVRYIATEKLILCKISNNNQP